MKRVVKFNFVVIIHSISSTGARSLDSFANGVAARSNNEFVVFLCPLILCKMSILVLALNIFRTKFKLVYCVENNI
jgi:hypothetical protein